MPAPSSISTRTSDLAEVAARDVRTDIQGLRAVAVLLVLGFHLWPGQVVGGFVGVDVFFVISGFLITSHLLRTPPRTLGGFASFWGRRLRRLLPASLLVIAVTVLVGTFVLPVTRLVTLGTEALTAALYVENWSLAISSVDYLGAVAPPSPLQHYWSLGVEEQFYLVWPLLIAFLAWIAARARTSAAVTATIGIGVFVFASLVVSIVWTFIEPASAYFATPTRLWELGAGGLIASATRIPKLGTVDAPAIVRSTAAWVGLALIGASSFLLTSASPFPGYLAIVPVSGACLVIVASTTVGSGSPARLLALRPVQFVGDTSYAIYLWHFPIIILVTAALGSAPNLPIKLAIIAATLVLAQLTRLAVEDPVRRARWLTRPQSRTYALAAVATLVVLAIALTPSVRVGAVVAAEAQAREVNAQANSGCLAADALGVPGCDLRGVGVTPSPALAANDKPAVYADNCFNWQPFNGFVTCTYGDETDPEYRVALVGNSHAAEWLPALQELAGERHFSITLFVASSCMPTSSAVAFDTAAATEGCRVWGERVIQQTIADDYDLVVTSVLSTPSMTAAPAADAYEVQQTGYEDTLRSWADAGVNVLVLRDTPLPSFTVPECVAAHLGDLAQCDGSQELWQRPDPMIGAADALGSPFVKTADLSSLFCRAGVCPSVIGGTLVYFDAVHVGETYMRSIAPYLAGAIDSGLEN